MEWEKGKLGKERTVGGYIGWVLGTAVGRRLLLYRLRTESGVG